MKIPDVKYKDIYSYDGTRIRYQDMGEGPVIVLANGLGGTFEAWYYLVEHLRKRFRIISWDYRGLYDSGQADLSRLTIADHVEDLNRILHEEKIDKVLLFGWSMGTQVIFEYYLRHPKQVLGLVPICGASGAPFDTALNFKPSRYLMPALFKTQKALGKPFGHILRALIKVPNAFELLTATRLFWKSGEDVIRDLVDAYVELDFIAYSQIMLELGRHDARASLGNIQAPALIIASTGDFFTPMHVSEHMRDTIPDAELHVMEGGTHYAPLEFPDRINGLVDDFINRKIKFPKPKKKAVKSKK